MDTAYGRRWIRRIGNCEYAFSCEDLALIRRISFPRYGVLTPNPDVVQKKKKGKQVVGESSSQTTSLKISIRQKILAIHVPNFDLTAIIDDQIERKNGGLGLECWREPQEPGSFTSAL
ncbi:hypothetical protein Tco_0548163 [Tanacetum coccineum]